jgi:hypothetical protein
VSDYLQAIILRTLQATPVVQPRPLARFEALLIPALPPWSNEAAEDNVYPGGFNQEHTQSRFSSAAQALPDMAQDVEPPSAQPVYPPLYSQVAPEGRARVEPPRAASPSAPRPDEPVRAASPSAPRPDEPVRPFAPPSLAPSAPVDLPAFHPPLPADTEDQHEVFRPVEPVSFNIAPDIQALAREVRYLLAEDEDQPTVWPEGPLSPRPAAHNLAPNSAAPPPSTRLEPAPIAPLVVSSPPTINVHIGTVEVRATPPPPEQRRAPKKTVIMSLDEYLRHRANGGQT